MSKMDKNRRLHTSKITTGQKTLISCTFALISIVFVAEIALRSSLPNQPDGVFCIEPGTCGEMADMLSDYLQETINQSYDRLQMCEENRQRERAKSKNAIALKSYLNTHFWQMTPAARVIGDMDKHGLEICGNDILCTVDMQPIIHWIHTGRVRDYSVFLRHGIKYRHGRLVVPVGGTYYVYAYIEMREPIWNKTTKVDRPPIRHALYKFNILGVEEIELISRTHLHRDSIGESEDNVYNSWIESVVKLDPGDEIMVKVSDVTYLKYPSSNYFGLNMV